MKLHLPGGELSAFFLLLNFWSILEDEVIFSKNILRNGYIHTQGTDYIIANDK